MNLVVDASVAIKWFLKDWSDEQHANLALQILERSVYGQLPMVQPPHFEAELAAVLARLKPTDAQNDLLDLAARYQHHLFDTLYHAVTLHTPGAMLVTADERYYNKAALEGQIVLLTDFKLPE